MGQIVPDAVERYLSGLNRQVDAVLADIARDGTEQELPLVDAEVGALLQVLATGGRRQADPRDRHGDRLLGHLAGRARCHRAACC